MKQRLSWFFIALICWIAMAYTLCSPTLPTASYAASPQFSGGSFRNPVPRHAIGTWKTLTLLWRFMVDKPALASPAQPLPVLALTQAELLAAPDKSLWRFGHSTMLLKMDGKFWLTDPVFAERASPVQFMGPKRFHAPPMGIADLPPSPASSCRTTTTTTWTAPPSSSWLLRWRTSSPRWVWATG